MAGILPGSRHALPGCLDSLEETRAYRPYRAACDGDNVQVRTAYVHKRTQAHNEFNGSNQGKPSNRAWRNLCLQRNDMAWIHARCYHHIRGDQCPRKTPPSCSQVAAVKPSPRSHPEFPNSTQMIASMLFEPNTSLLFAVWQGPSLTLGRAIGLTRSISSTSWVVSTTPPSDTGMLVLPSMSRV
eukprot:CAMPEP_0195099710 /NCGR_PEP_ID=MMETSP0448-20130528/59127_1 /TAXON_ID=66468 /ORGANISM="Heterocapsa triquestra, Strain CCMP 448" /LENGTH=183 /DNA_ID=CAMNT_0040134663 /DNA_START=77 /DNA_END=625 /DNA_ORIENTATION=+